ncbi:membrane bound O-acyl transferase family-domain-containing protein [Aspergillus pseudodeflectus]|uniref:Membrane bound O-acyl transferase family-domain-containing protein n=1 Tax=Aspergillus pseudodeflectus TaxID=176178 RepID=A0ABR4JXW9_9EURO
MFAWLLIAATGVCLAQQLIATILIAALTAPKSNVRRVGATLILLFGCCQGYLIYYLFPWEFAQALVQALLPGTCFVQFHYLLFNPAGDATVPPSFMKLSWTAWVRIFVQVIRDSRGVPSPASPTRSTEATLDRAAFFRRRFAQYARNALIPEVMWFLGRREFGVSTPEWDHVLSPGTEYLLLRLTFRQLQARIVATAGVWIMVYCTVDTFDCLILTAAVVLGDNHPEDWQPMFGSLRDAFSLRGFWGKFWHRLIRRPLIDFSTALLRLVSANPGKRRDIAFVCIVFVLSGLVHVTMDIAFWAIAGAPSFPLFLFFCKNVVAILLETIVVRYYRGYRRRHGRLAEWTWTVERALGYIWVFLFLCYASPPTFYPVLRVLGSENHWSLYWPIP